MAQKGKFKVVTVRRLKKEHVPRAKAPTVALDTARIPSSLHELIPYAEKWGVSDDTTREELLTSTPPAQLRDVLDKVTAFAGPFRVAGRKRSKVIDTFERIRGFFGFADVRR